MFMGTNRHDLTFSTNLFSNYPPTFRPMHGFNCEIDKKY